MSKKHNRFRANMPKEQLDQLQGTEVKAKRTRFGKVYALGANRFQQYFRVLLPAALPSLMDDMRLTIGWAWTYLVVAEMVAADAGLGYMILKNQRFLATDVIFAGLIMIGLVGLVTDWIFRVATRLIVPWQERLNAK